MPVAHAPEPSPFARLGRSECIAIEDVEEPANSLGSLRLVHAATEVECEGNVPWPLVEPIDVAVQQRTRCRSSSAIWRKYLGHSGI